MKSHTPSTDCVQQTKAAPEAVWFARRRDPQLALQTEEEFQAWLAANPENAVRYAQCDLAWERTAELADDDDMKGWLRDLDSKTTARTVRRRNARPMWALAATVLIVICGASGLFYFNGPTIYRTAVGEQRDVTLPDGSRVTLNTATRIAVRYDKQMRRIELTTGEALFDVRKDSLRPFEVAAGLGTARAIGTRFTVERSDTGIKVSVLEGIVALVREEGDSTHRASSPAGKRNMLLEDGQAAALAHDGKMSSVVPANLHRIQAWQDRRLDFDSTPLEEAIAEVNRYSTRPLVLGQPQLKELHVSGMFHIATLEGFTFALQQSFGLRVVENNGELLLLPPP